jgi:RNA polymerase sigma-70 factor (ECF subfamily)
MDSDDTTLVERARGGDDGAFETLCRRHEAAVRRHLYRKLPASLRKRLSTADVVQEVLILALERIRGLDRPFKGSFRVWLLRIAEYKAKEAARFHLDTAKRAVGAEISSPHRPITEALRGARTTPSGYAVATESRERVKEYLAALPDDYGLILDLVYIQGMPIADAARRLGRSPAAGRQLHARAIAALAEQMEDKNGDTDGRR